MNAGGHSQPHAATIPHGVFKRMKFSCRGATAHLSTLPNEAKRDAVEAEWDAVLCTCAAAPCGAKD